MGDLEPKTSGTSTGTSPASARADDAIGKHPITGDVSPAPHAPPAKPGADANGLTFDAMLAAVLAAQRLTEAATHGDTAALTQALKLLAPIEARMSQLNDHQGRLASFGAGNIAGQAALDMAQTAIVAWRQRLALGTVVRADELVLRFRAGAEPIRVLTGEAKDAPTLREFDHVSRVVGVAAATPVLAPALVALAASEAPLLAFAARGAAQRVSLWALSHPAAALAAAEALLGLGVQIGEGGWQAFWSQLGDPQGRWLFLAQVLMDFMHVQSGMHPDAPRRTGVPGGAAEPPDVDAARQRLGKIRTILQHVDDAAAAPPARQAPGDHTAEQSPYAPELIVSAEGPAMDVPGGARKPKHPRPSFGKAYPDNPFEHIKQRQGNWCGAACGQMSASRLGAEVDQAELVATPHFEQPNQSTNHAGGFQTAGLEAALKEVAHVPGRMWRAGPIPEDVSKPDGLLKHLKGYLKATQSSIILRIARGKHWIIIDGVTPDDRFIIRDPGESMSTVLTPQELHARFPTGEAVFSFPITENNP